MEKDRDANYSEKMYTNGWPYEDLTGTSAPGQDMSFFRDDESKVWERRLMAPDLGLDESALQLSKETRSFLWKAGLVPYVSDQPLTGVLPENSDAEIDEQDFQAQRGLGYPERARPHQLCRQYGLRHPVRRKLRQPVTLQTKRRHNPFPFRSIRRRQEGHFHLRERPQINAGQAGSPQ